MSRTDPNGASVLYCEYYGATLNAKHKRPIRCEECMREKGK